MQIKFEYSEFWLIFSLSFSLLFAIYIYYNDSRFSTQKTLLKIFLVLLRFISLSILIFLLFKARIIIKSKTFIKPKIAFLIDKSASIVQNHDSSYYKNEFIKVIDLNNKILNKYFDLFEYDFSNNIHENIRLNYDGKETNISKSLKNIYSEFDETNLNAIILCSDGIINSGKNPIYDVKNKNIPIFTIAMGDSIDYPDLSIENLTYNKYVSSENKFPIKFDIKSNILDISSNIKIYRDDDLIHFEKILINKKNITRKIYLDGSKNKKNQFYKISIQPIKNEKNIFNNIKEFGNEIINDKHNILILYDQPHPDIASLKTSLEKNKNYKIQTSAIKNFKSNFKNYSLVIFHNIPNKYNAHLNKFSELKFLNIPQLFFLGINTDWQEFNNLQNFVSIQSKNNNEETFNNLNSNFTHFELTNGLNNFLINSPPILSPSVSAIFLSEKKVLLQKKIDNKIIGDLLFFSDDEKIGIFLGENIWKWKMFEYRLNNNNNNFDNLFYKICESLKLRKKLDKLNITYPKISNNEVFRITANLYNDNYEIVTDSEFSIDIYKQNELIFNSKFEPIDSFFVFETSLSEGEYKFHVNSNYKNEKYKKNGIVKILKYSKEKKNTKSNWNLLKQISKESNGKFISKNEISNYSEIIINKLKNEYFNNFNEEEKFFIKEKLIFLLLLLSLSIEWLIRKRLGTY